MFCEAGKGFIDGILGFIDEVEGFFPWSGFCLSSHTKSMCDVIEYNGCKL